MTSTQEFKLIFEGPADDSEATLRKLKGALLADFDLSVERVTEILSQIPYTMKSAASKEDLARDYTLLKNAGAKVLIVQPVAEEEKPEPAHEDSDEVVFEFEIDGSDDVDDILGNSGISDHEAEAEMEKMDSDPDIKSEIDQLLNKLDSETILVKPEPKLPPVIKNAPVPEAPKASPTPTPAKDEEDALIPAPDPETPLAAVPVIEDLLIEPDFEETAAPQEVIEEIVPPSKEDPIESAPATHVPPPEKQKKSGKEAEGPELPTLPFLRKEDQMELPKRKDGGSSEDGARRRTGPRLRARHLVETALTGVISIAILFIGAFFFGPERNVPAPIKPAVQEDDAEQNRAAAEEAKRAEEEAKKIFTKAQLIGKVTTPTEEIRVKFDVDERKLKTVSIRITTPRPPALTPEEIVRKTPPHPWIKEIQADRLVVTDIGGGKYVVKGEAQTFIEDGEIRTRLGADVTLFGKFNPDDGTATGKLTVVRSYKDIPEETKTHIEKLEAGGYRLLVSADITAKKEVP